MTTQVVFLSGAGLPAWVWDEVRSRVPGHTSVAAYAKGRATLREVVAGVVAGMADGPCHLVAHSLGGTVAAGVVAMSPDRVTAVTGVSAIVPRAGASFASSLPVPQRYVLSAMIRLLGTKPPESVLRGQLAGGLDADVADRVVAGFEPESRRVYLDKVPAHSWPADTAYLVTSEDREFPVALQESYAAVLGATTSTVSSGHLPMLSHPEVVAATVNRASRQA